MPIAKKPALPIHHSIPPAAADTLRRLEKVFLKEPRKLFMGEWLISGKRDIQFKAERTEDLMPPCGTVGCIAGWLSASRKGIAINLKFGYSWPRDIGSEVLVVDDDLAAQLFYVTNWPANFRSRLEATKNGTLEYAQVVVDRMEDFIANGR
jgi:hypothetical protein